MAHMVIQWHIELVTVTSHYCQHCQLSSVTARAMCAMCAHYCQHCQLSSVTARAMCAQQNAAPGTLHISSTNCELLLLAGLCC